MRLTIAIALALFCVPTVAIAQDSYSDGRDGSNSFTGLRGSLAFEGQATGKASTTTPIIVKGNTKVGGGGSIYWGWRLPYGFKTELELLYRYQPLSKIAVNGVSGTLGGYTETASPIINAYWDLPVGDIGIHPFLGAGVGYGWNETGVSSIAGTSFPTVHNDNWHFAYNLMAGLSVPLSDGSRLTGMYRWYHEQTGLNCATGISCSAHFNTSSVDLGLELDL